jgi:hypothetical protein
MQTIPSLPIHQRFDFEVVRSMSVAYTDLCRTLGLSTLPNAANEVVAHKIMEIAEDTHDDVSPCHGGLQGRQVNTSDPRRVP